MCWSGKKHNRYGQQRSEKERYEWLWWSTIHVIFGEKKGRWGRENHFCQLNIYTIYWVFYLLLILFLVYTSVKFLSSYILWFHQWFSVHVSYLNLVTPFCPALYISIVHAFMFVCACACVYVCVFNRFSPCVYICVFFITLFVHVSLIFFLHFSFHF